jgi:hypothetical protein
MEYIVQITANMGIVASVVILTTMAVINSFK